MKDSSNNVIGENNTNGTNNNLNGNNNGNNRMLTSGLLALAGIRKSRR